MKKQVYVRLKDMQNLVMGPKGRPDTKTYWPTDRRSQIQLQSTKLTNSVELSTTREVTSYAATEINDRVGSAALTTRHSSIHKCWH
jgi:hypothetical protein